MYICHRIGEVAEWSNAAVLKTVEGHTSGGSNPSFSAFKFPNIFIINMLGFFIITICTIIVRSDVKSQKNLTQKFKELPPLGQNKFTFPFRVARV